MAFANPAPELPTTAHPPATVDVAPPGPDLEVGAVVRFRRPGTRKRWVQGHFRRLGSDGSLDIFAPDGGFRTVPAAWCERPASGARPGAWEPVVRPTEHADGATRRRRAGSAPAGTGR